ncbi:pyocin knob domain-containing protein [Tropicimonas sp. IMCC34011]|uniref:pyocin knob domain-containing protein n=1 Tax=Tropicimonas sp. IMCC34011 TaxID=2248759 RepID=UPI000E281C3D|nr:pyocin knob domain-containing protein [Tropicimonas sp. IMCC34011]
MADRNFPLDFADIPSIADDVDLFAASAAGNAYKLLVGTLHNHILRSEPIADWNAATRSGYVFDDGDAANAPVAGLLTGQVTSSGTRIWQTAINEDRDIVYSRTSSDTGASWTAWAAKEDLPPITDDDDLSVDQGNLPTRGNVDANFANTPTLLQDISAAGLAQVDIALDIATYRTFRVEIVNASPAVDGAKLYLRTSSDGGVSFDEGAEDYSFAGRSQRSDTGGDEFKLANSDEIWLHAYTIGSAAGAGLSGTVDIFSAESGYMTVTGQCGYGLPGGQFSQAGMSGRRKSATPVNAVRLFFDNGSIASGRVCIWGMGRFA